MKEKEVKIVYSEPLEYFPKEIRKEYKLGEYAEEDTISEKFVNDLKKLFKYKSYYVYDFELENIQVAEGEDHDAAQELYDQLAKDCVSYEVNQWAFDIALDCISNMTDKECASIREQCEITDYHFGYGMHIRNKYVYPSKLHFYGMADLISSSVETFIYAILIEEENA